LVVPSLQTQIRILYSHQTDVASLPSFLLCTGDDFLVLTAVLRIYSIGTRKDSELITIKGLVANSTAFKLADRLRSHLVVA
jgi:hypothetical protein